MIDYINAAVLIQSKEGQEKLSLSHLRLDWETTRRPKFGSLAVAQQDAPSMPGLKGVRCLIAMQNKWPPSFVAVRGGGT